MTTATAPITARAPRKKVTRENPLGLLISLIKEKPTAFEPAHLGNFRKTLLLPGYEDFLEAVIAEWFSLRYNTAYRAAFPPSKDEIRERALKRRALQTAQESAVVSAKLLIGERMLYFIMPNGKRLSECTGAECVKFGGQFTKIGKAVGARKKVGSVLSAADLTALLSTR